MSSTCRMNSVFVDIARKIYDYSNHGTDVFRFTDIPDIQYGAGIARAMMNEGWVIRTAVVSNREPYWYKLSEQAIEKLSGKYDGKRRSII